MTVQTAGNVGRAARTVRIRAATIDDTGQSAGRVPSIHRQLHVGPVTVSDITFRSAVTVDCDDVGSGYYVHLPVAGRLDSRHGGADLTATRELAAVYQPGGGPFSGRWEANTRVLCVRLDGAAVRSAVAALPGGTPAAGAKLGLAMDTRRGHGSSWAGLLLSLSRQPTGPNGLLAHPPVAAPLAESLVNGFLLAAGLSRAADVSAPAKPAGIRMAVDLIEADPQAPLTVAAIAASCGMSVRTLQSNFLRYVGMSPMAYLRDVRLRRANAELRAADPAGDTVAGIAWRWGFAHLGRFAAAYRAKYKETPGQTLRATC